MSIYCTYLTVYLGSKLPMFYIGSSSVARVNKGYHGSVKSREYKNIWELELKENPQLFETKIIKTFAYRKEALEAEYKYQKHLKVVKSSMYVNKSLAAPNGFFGMDNTGHKHSEETLIKLRNAKLGNKNPNFGPGGNRLGATHTDETRYKLKIANLGKSQLIVTCLHCGKSGGISNMKRWHFENCKQKI